jgi:hypothetical protein
VRSFFPILATAALLAVAPADAYVINGLLDDWGVQPHIQWIPSSPSVNWIEEDNWGSGHPNFPSGGEIYDAEALYCDFTGGMAYVALVTSFPSSGYMYCYPGDIGIDLDRDGIYEYGLKTTGPLQGGFFANPTWTKATTYPSSGPARIIGGTLLDVQPLVYFETEIMENGFPTHIIEGRFDWSALGSPSQPFNLHWTESCGNDMLNLTVSPVPEPGTLLLLGPGCAALCGLSWRRRRKKK